MLKHIGVWYFAFRFGLSLIGPDIVGSFAVGPFDTKAECEKAKEFISNFIQDREVLKAECQQLKGDKA